MKRIAGMLVCIFAQANVAFSEGEDNTVDRMFLLESQVAALSAEVKEQRMVMLDLQAKLARLAYLLDDSGETIEQSEPFSKLSCQARRAYAVRKRDFLSSQGLKPTHPDMVNINAMLSRIERDCSVTE